MKINIVNCYRALMSNICHPLRHTYAKRTWKKTVFFILHEKNAEGPKTSLQVVLMFNSIQIILITAIVIVIIK